MLSLKNRLKKQKDFENVFKNGRGFKEGSLYLKIDKNNLQSSRFGFVVSKKFSKKAINRNRIKRILREVVKERIDAVKKGMDIVIVVSPEIKADFQELKEITNKLFKKSGLI